MENKLLRFRGKFQEVGPHRNHGRIYPFRVLEDNIGRLNAAAVDAYMQQLNGDAEKRLTVIPYDPELGL